MRARARTWGVVRLGIGVLVAVLPVWVGLGGEGTFELAKTNFARMSTGGLLVIWLLTREAPKIRGRASRQIILTVVFAASVGVANAMATVLSILPSRSLWGSETWGGGLLTTLCQIVLFLIAADVLGSDRSIRSLEFAACLGSLPVSFYALAQAAGMDPVTWNLNWPTYGGVFRVFGTLGNPSILGGYLAMVLPLTLALFVVAGRRGERVCFGALASLQAGALFLSLSRGAWLAMVIAVAALGAVSRKRFLLVLSGVGLLGLVAIGSLRYDPSVDTTQVRPLLWKCSVAMIARRPFVGYGPETFDLAFPQYVAESAMLECNQVAHFDYAHNLWLDIAAESGVLGLSAWLAFLVTLFGILAGLSRIAPSPRLVAVAALMAGAVAYLVQAQFMFPTIVPETLFWVLCGACAGSLRVSGVPERNISAVG